MLIDRCLLTKNKSTSEWIGVIEIKKREGERWRMAAWLATFITLFEVFRISHYNWLSISAAEYVGLFFAAFAAIFFFRQSSKCATTREAVFVVPPAVPVYDAVGQTIGFQRTVLLPRDGCDKAKADAWERFEVDRFTHVVFGIIEVPMPGRPGVSIDAYAVYLAEQDGTPHAVVTGSYDKYSTFTLARRLAALTKLKLIEMGKGHPFEG